MVRSLLAALLLATLISSARATSDSNHEKYIVFIVNNKSDILDRFSKTRARFRPVGLWCPDQNNGVLEQTKMNSDGIFMHSKYFFEGPEIVRFIVFVAERGRRLELAKEFDLVRPRNEDEKLTGEKVINGIYLVMGKVCRGTQEYRSRYKEMMRSIRSELFVSEIDVNFLKSSSD